MSGTIPPLLHMPSRHARGLIDCRVPVPWNLRSEKVVIDEGQGWGQVSVLWQHVSERIRVANTSAARIFGSFCSV